MEVKRVKQKKVMDSNCPSCGAQLKYSPEHTALFCENCKTIKTIKFDYGVNKKPYTGNETKNSDEEYQKWQNQEKFLKCSTCGANVELDKLEFSGTCPYCGTSTIAQVEDLPGEKPDGIIPFKFSRQEASDLYVKGMKKKFFLPNAFKKAVPSENIKGIYIPSFGYDANSFSTYSGVLERDEHYTDSQGKRHTKTIRFKISGKKDLKHTNVLVETSTVLTQAKFEEIKPYEMGLVVKYNPQFILGYSVEHFDNAVTACKKIADDIFKKQIRNAILSGYSYDRVAYLDVKTQLSEEKYAYYLLPIYQNDYEYKDKKYTTFMNGQTGKVGGGVPRSKIKITFFTLFIILLIGFIAFLFMYFGE